MFATQAGSLWVREKDWRPAVLATQIAALLTRPDDWAAASQRLRRLATDAAASVIVADCEAVLGATS